MERNLVTVSIEGIFCHMLHSRNCWKLRRAFLSSNYSNAVRKQGGAHRANLCYLVAINQPSTNPTRQLVDSYSGVGKQFKVKVSMKRLRMSARVIQRNRKQLSPKTDGNSCSSQDAITCRGKEATQKQQNTLFCLSRYSEGNLCKFILWVIRCAIR